MSHYETGRPAEGYTDEEAAHNYRSVAGRLSPQEYEEAAAESFGRMSRQERQEFTRLMWERSGGRLDVAGDDPRDLARTTARFRQEESNGGGLASLFAFGDGDEGGRGGDLLGAARGGRGGGGLGDLMGNPLAKVALGGIAAVAMKKVLGGR